MRQLRHTDRARRERGSVYILVLGASLLVAAIGVSSLMAARVQHRTVTAAADRAQARELARTAIDGGLWLVKHNPLGWRATLDVGAVKDIAFSGGTYTLLAFDPVDGNLLDDTTNPVVLVGEGCKGQATYILRVTLNGDGTVRGGTWQRVVQGDD